MLPIVAVLRGQSRGIQIVGVLMFSAVVIGCGEPRKPQAGGQETTAFVMCQDPVRGQLRAPSTAEFPYTTAPGVSVAHLGDGVYKVNAFVDAQNGFGAMLRTSWTCEIAENSNQTWSLRELKLEKD